jgi:hypothetical protein
MKVISTRSIGDEIVAGPDDVVRGALDQLDIHTPRPARR